MYSSHCNWPALKLTQFLHSPWEWRGSVVPRRPASGTCLFLVALKDFLGSLGAVSLVNPRDGKGHRQKCCLYYQDLAPGLPRRPRTLRCLLPPDTDGDWLCPQEACKTQSSKPNPHATEPALLGQTTPKLFACLEPPSTTQPHQGRLLHLPDKQRFLFFKPLLHSQAVRRLRSTWQEMF